MKFYHISIPNLKFYTIELAFAEHLIDAAKSLLFPSGRLIRCSGNDGEREFTIVHLAIRFYNMPLEFKFRALVESWDRSKIVSEMSAYGN